MSSSSSPHASLTFLGPHSFPRRWPCDSAANRVELLVAALSLTYCTTGALWDPNVGEAERLLSSTPADGGDPPRVLDLGSFPTPGLRRSPCHHTVPETHFPLGRGVQVAARQPRGPSRWRSGTRTSSASELVSAGPTRPAGSYLAAESVPTEAVSFPHRSDPFGPDVSARVLLPCGRRGLTERGCGWVCNRYLPPYVCSLSFPLSIQV